MNALRRRSFSCGIAMLLATFCLPAPVLAAEVDPGLRTEALRSGSADTLIVLSAQAPKHLLRTDTDYLSRRRALVDMLRSTADTSQAELRQWLDAQGVAYRPYWIVNMVQAHLTAPQIDALAARGEVGRIVSNAPARMDLPQPEPAPERAPQAVVWGVAKVRAPELWALGINGAGVVVAGQDTGIRWTHAALKGKYRGWDALSQTADHNYNWHDAIHSPNGSCPADSPQPCDDHSHGSHTVGSIVGDDGGANQIGVAPGAKWIGCRNMDAGAGTPATYNECAQWFLAPTDLAGQNADPDRAPDVINNSWGCVPEEGCAGTGAEVREAIENLVAGGILFVASAGNNGSGCGTIFNAPGTLDSVLTVGGTASNNTMYTSSSRGPVPVTPGTGVNNKPDVIAPAVLVPSATNGSDAGYNSFSGTSMASPHVAGAAALLMQVNPGLKGNPALVAQILRNTAVPLTTTSQVCNGIPSTTFPNPVQGRGQIDVVAAFAVAEKIFRGDFENAP